MRLRSGLLGLTLVFLALAGCDQGIPLLHRDPPGHPPPDSGPDEFAFDGGPGFCFFGGGLDAGLPLPPAGDAGFFDAGSPVIVESAVAPAPIIGGTLLATSDGKLLVAADADRDRVYFVSAATRALVKDVALSPGDEPGRLVEDDVHRIHVALRRAGALATFDAATHELVSRRALCPGVRGLAFDAPSGKILAACATGELVSLPAAGGDVTERRQLGDDLRDVLRLGAKTFVTRFKEAQLLELGASGFLSQRGPSEATSLDRKAFTASVAYRAIPLSDSSVAMVHQRVVTTPVDPNCGGYGQGRQSIVMAGVTTFSGADLQQVGTACELAVLPVDVAVRPDGKELAIVAAGSRSIIRYPLPLNGTGLCDGFSSGSPLFTDGALPTAAAYAGDALVYQTSAPALVFVTSNGAVQTRMELPGEPRQHTGHQIFHADPGGGIACASCHPEGGEDGRTWTFVGIGPRRTQPLRGGVLATAPFHWDGDQTDLGALMADVFVRRMHGPPLQATQTASLGRWLDSLPAPSRPSVTDSASVARGEALFRSAAVGCASCHSGARYTNNLSADVGTGGRFQVPQLVGLAARAPFLHNGCAPTLEARFGACGGGDLHGVTSKLTASELADLVAFLKTL